VIAPGAGGRARTLLAAAIAAALGAMLLVAVPAARRAASAETAVFPRFATLRAARVNLRFGPGPQYPIKWVYRRAGWPVEVIAAYGSWYRVRDADGTEGWVSRLLLSTKRTVAVEGRIRRLREAPDERAAVVARIEPGVVARLDECRGDWCRIEAAGREGWIGRAALWGVRDGAAGGAHG
jgi:SH3-like domain-containing protein